MARPSLAVETQGITQAIQKRFPDLSQNEVVRLRNVLLGEVGTHMNQEDDLAFLRKNPDGTADLSVLSLDVLKRRGGR